METSGLNSFLFTAQDKGVQFLTCRSVATSFSVATIPKEMSADYVLDILMGNRLVLSVIYELSQRLVHGFMGVTADEYIDSFKAICRSVVYIVFCLVRYTDYIVDLFALSVTSVSYAYVHEGSFATIAVLNTQCQGNVI